MTEAEVSREDLFSHLRYDARSGVFTWIRSCRRIKAGDEAGCIDKKTGYRLIGIGGVKIRAHRLAWLWVHGAWPTFEIDHINGRRDDNRIENLRDVCHHANAINRSVCKGTLKNPFPGVRLRPDGYEAVLAFKGKKFRLGVFPTSILAAEAIYAERGKRLQEIS